MTARVVVIHEVDDYDRWTSAFDAAESIRRAGGEVDFEVLHAEDDANLIVHIATWTSLDDARRFFESAEVAAIRTAAGVREPTFLYMRRRAGGPDVGPTLRA